MRIAITSCCNAPCFENQPVWNNMATHRPDVLVLLGDSIYYDVPWPVVGGEAMQPYDMPIGDFLRYGMGLYQRQLSMPGFRTLIRNVPHKYAIWDDHDFLFNGAAGDNLPKAIYGGHIRASRALFKTYREALAAGDPDVFPTNEGDPRLNDAYEPAPGYQAVDLPGNVCLHLTDGRSFRSKIHLLGSTQRGQMTAEMQRRPDHVHLVASGIVYEREKGERWSAFPEDYDWMRQMAAKYRILVLSGDIHGNRVPQPIAVPGGHNIHEITSSGAAIGKLVSFGEQLHNFGIVEIDGGRVKLSTYRDTGGTRDNYRELGIADWR
jgi:hypothetical protein